MLSVKLISSALAEKLTGITGQKELLPKITYGLEMIIGETTKLICILLTAYILDLFLATLFLMIAIIPLRIITGGGHCTSSLRCLVTATVSYLIMAVTSAFLAKNIPLVFLLGLCLFSYSLFTVVVDRFGPGNSVNYPNPSHEVIEKTKRTVFGAMTIYTIVILNTFYIAKTEISSLFLASAAIGGLWQLLMVTTFGQRMIAIIDKSLLFAKIK
ncbi:MAG: accessory gene regulator B family protein [Thermincola sp.]|jgi:accessory gene regulator B|nr:accessory gene regulator B family protein [Thermincola sp.]MDT3701935.1 accessory gene regulator B family protein [Thermincola sp.]